MYRFRVAKVRFLFMRISHCTKCNAEAKDICFFYNFQLLAFYIVLFPTFALVLNVLYGVLKEVMFFRILFFLYLLTTQIRRKIWLLTM